MKVLSVQQPWASLIVHGLKRCETRGWATLYRGALAIHAARRFRTAQRRLCVQPPIAQLLAAAGISAPAVLPVGCIVGVVTVVDCVPACDVAARIDGLEQQLGEYGDELFAWLLTDPVALADPVPYAGQLGLRELPEDVVRNLQASCGCRPLTGELENSSPLLP